MSTNDDTILVGFDERDRPLTLAADFGSPGEGMIYRTLRGEQDCVGSLLCVQENPDDFPGVNQGWLSEAARALGLAY